MSALRKACCALSSWLLLGCAGASPGPNDAASERARAPRGAELLALADVLASSGDHVRAGQYLVAAQASGVPAQQVIGRLLRLDAAGGQYRLAIEHAEAYLRVHPADAGVRRCLASFYAAIGASSDAEREYARVLRERPDDAQAHFALATLLREAGIERARMDTHYRAYIALAPQGPYVEEARAQLLEELP